MTKQNETISDKNANFNMLDLDTSSLTKLELLYFKMMRARGAVPFVKGRPGEAKTAIIRSISKKLGLQYIDIRLSQIDEIVVTGYPHTSDDGKSFDFVTPAWALRANSTPSIICFEEYNRAKLEQRNAAMQIMAEREVGMNLKLNDNVLIIATGNLGEEDGTDVEEIESAQRGRLATIKHKLTIADWKEGYANENVHELILAFIDANPDAFYKYEREDVSDSYASARSWDYLSRYIISNYGTMATQNTNLPQLINDLRQIGKSYVGTTSNKFIKYIEQMSRISILDILNRFDEIKKMASAFSRPMVSEYLTQLADDKMDIEALSKAQVDNLNKFLKTVSDDDELVSFFRKIVEKIDFMAVKLNPSIMNNTKVIIDSFPKIKSRMKTRNT